MFFLDGRLVSSASDLKAASECEFALLRALDARLGRVDAVEDPEDTMLERAARLGDAHELRQLARYEDEFGVASRPGERGVVVIERPERTVEAIESAARRTLEALRGRADVVYQGTFFDGSFIGYADFLVRAGERVEVYDTKLARTARVTALLQLAAYAEQLERVGIPVGEEVHLLLGDGTRSTHRLRDILPVFRLRRYRLARIVGERIAADGPVEWRDPRYEACGRCATCEQEVERTRDPLLVGGIRRTQRDRLLEAGVETIDALAESVGPVEGFAEPVLAGLRAQARLQLLPPEPLPYEVVDAAALEVLPPPDPGDLFFDFEGDPLHVETLGGREQWNLDYLFGVVEGDTEEFRPFWAHDFAQEREALLAFLAYVARRRAMHPHLHVYHYASYERVHLQSLCARHGVGEDQLDELLRANVLVDLYPIVKKSVRVGTRSYSLKKLEPLYMGEERRESEVRTGGESVDFYLEYTRLRDNGERAQAERVLGEIADYNRYDCVSTLRLRDWLLARAAEHGVPSLGVLDLAAEQTDEAPNPLRDELRRLAGDPLDPERDDDETALALAAAALDFHRRERKTFWWEHFNRLVAPLEEWQDVRDVFLVDEATVEADWAPEGARGTIRRHLRLTGRAGAGTRLREEDCTLVYERPGPFPVPGIERGVRPWTMRATIAQVVSEGELRVVETLGRDESAYSDLPFAVTPGRPIPHNAQEAAIAEWASGLLAARRAVPPGWPPDAATDLLRRRSPRGSGLVPVTDGETVEAIRESLLGLDDSYLAVQGPPGTGKTWVGAHVVAALVREHGWRVGVVAQSHQVVEHMLEGVIAAGLDRALVGKKVRREELRSVERGERTVAFTPVDERAVPAFTSARPRGFVLGGTAWDFPHAGRVARRSLDLLVIDEAGQFSLADTIAVSVAARRLLLLGDPQQLPQVSQGIHPEPVDRSALGWLAGASEVLPADRGYFLAESWRMHPAVAASVSALAYDGKLRSRDERTAARSLAGLAPGVHPVPVEHAGNATCSEEEAEAVVAIVRDLLGAAWTAPDAGRLASPLEPADLIVVAPYNAQVDLVETRLAEAGVEGVRVGTVDRFQGQEAVVAIVTLAASSPAEVPRGMRFLLLPNRLNVAVSRAQWAAFVVHSPALTGSLPRTPEALTHLSRFVTLVRADAGTGGWAVEAVSGRAAAAGAR